MTPELFPTANDFSRKALDDSFRYPDIVKEIGRAHV